MLAKSDRFKFRIWDLELKAYREGRNCPGACQFIDPAEGMATCGDGCEIYGTDGERTILEQCTGIKDKNNKLIYENDIVLYNDIEYIIEWVGIECRWYFDSVDENNPDIEYLDAEISKYIEIVGNIHQYTSNKPYPIKNIELIKNYVEKKDFNNYK